MLQQFRIFLLSFCVIHMYVVYTVVVFFILFFLFLFLFIFCCICTYPIFIALAREPLHTSARERAFLYHSIVAVAATNSTQCEKIINIYSRGNDRQTKSMADSRRVAKHFTRENRLN